MGIITPTNKEVTRFKGVHLYHAGMSNCSMRVRMTLEEKSVPWTSHHRDLRRAENITPEYFGIHPKGLVPALVHDGVVIIESTDIIDYLDKTFPDPPLRPTNEADLLEMYQWLQQAASNHMYVKTYMFGKQIGSSFKKSESELARYRELQSNEELLAFHHKNSTDGLSAEDLSNAADVLHRCFQRIDHELGSHEWIVGDDFSLADITWIPLHVTLNNARFPFDEYQNVVRWKEAIHGRPSYESAVLNWMPKDLIPKENEHKRPPSQLN